ncbi:MAG: hypothetical protein IJA60_06570 [Clostridia bacterium]|nr:hypothetical protein [Clostridia bacterium]
MKRTVSLLLCAVMLCTFSVFAMAYEGENYVQFSSDEVVFPIGQHIAGDSNGDGKVNLLDAMTSIKYVAGTKTSSLRDSIDTNSDGKVNIADVLLIIRHVLGEDVGLGKLVD